MILFQSGATNHIIPAGLESEIGPIRTKTIIAAADSMNQLITTASIISGKSAIVDLVYMY
jgi:hypothetical protein